MKRFTGRSRGRYFYKDEPTARNASNMNEDGGLLQWQSDPLDGVLEAPKQAV